VKGHKGRDTCYLTLSRSDLSPVESCTGIHCCMGLMLGHLAFEHANRAAGSLPCDLYASVGTPCVAAHSTVRALFSAYTGTSTRSGARRITQLRHRRALCGRLCQRPPHRSFCSGTTCVITIIYDQSGRGNNLTQRQVVGPLVALISRQTRARCL